MRTGRIQTIVRYNLKLNTMKQIIFMGLLVLYVILLINACKVHGIDEGTRRYSNYHINWYKPNFGVIYLHTTMAKLKTTKLVGNYEVFIEDAVTPLLP
jgi:hypothetical protein